MNNAYLVSNGTITGTSISNCYTQPMLDCLVSPGAKLPQRAHRTDAGADLFSYEQCEIYPGEQKLVDTGIAIKIPEGFVGFIYNRSSQGKKGITIPHSVGVIDSDYRGNLKVLLKNIGEDPYKIEVGDRIAQLVIQQVEEAEFIEVESLPGSDRGSGGFGSTGKNS